jgi:haloalkane dehalogenase
MKDSVIKPHNLKKFQSGFTNFKTVELETSGHFPQEEQPEKVANAIFDILTQKKNQS